MRRALDGTEEYFSAADVQLGGESDAALDVGGWDGDDMAIVIDGREQTLDNAAGNNQVYLPYVTTH